MLQPLISLFSILLILSMAAGNQDYFDEGSDFEKEYNNLAFQINTREKDPQVIARLKKEALSEHALIWETDLTPTDVVSRRTGVLLAHLAKKESNNTLELLAKEYDQLMTHKEALSTKKAESEKKLFIEFCALRRKIAFTNPVLDFNQIIFLKHNKMRRGERHMVDQYEGFNAAPGGGVFVLNNPFGEHPSLQNLLKDRLVENGRLKGQSLEEGSFVTLDLAYDGDEILFAYTEAKDVHKESSWKGQYWTEKEAKKDNKAQYFWDQSTSYHIFKANADGSALTQLTDGKFNDFDPCFLPNDRITFISERRGGFLRCGARPNPTFTLHGMMTDGSDIIPLSYHETNEWGPSVNNSGMLVYTRWDYVDRDSDIAHHIWHTYPDGRDPRSYHGNYPEKRESRPWMEMSIRAIPNSNKYIAVAAPHHGENYGSLVMIDLHKEDDRSTNQILRITPEAHFPEAESRPGVAQRKGKHNPKGEVYGSPWPLNENFYLAVYDTNQDKYGIYLVDCFGNKILLYQDQEFACLDPIPLVKKKKPVIIPIQTTQAKADKKEEDTGKANVIVLNVYDSELPWPENTKITDLRIVQVFPKTTRIADDPFIGVGNQSLARGVIGTVPVEEDGSANFTVPTGIPIYFQALDSMGRAVQTMRSVTYLHEGETLTCIGCHDKKFKPTSFGGMKATALKREPSAPVNLVDNSHPLLFPTLIQPVIDNKCLDCHDSNKKAPSLKGNRFGENGWSEAYHTLAPLAWAKSGGNGALISKNNNISYSIPGEVGALDSRLYKMLQNGHHDVELTKEEMQKFITWLDCNSVFYGTYESPKIQAKGIVVQPWLF
jgi:hypothetical protein